jgi:phosphate transport system substrate-binding protein
VSRRRIRLAAVIATLALFATVPAMAQAKKIITISGSTSVFPLETKLARAWIKTKKGKKFGFKISQGGSNVGVSDVSKGRVSIGASSRDPATGDPGGLVFTKISKDALCVATHPSNRLANITTAQVRGIYLTGPGTWETAVSGATVGGPITAVGRAPTSGTHDAFRSLFLGGTNQASYVAGLASNGLVQQRVAGNPNAIGYVSLAFQSGVNIVSYNGVTCDLRNAISGTYGGTRNFWFVTQGAPSGGVKKFVNWILKSKKANNIIRTEWVPLR